MKTLIAKIEQRIKKIRKQCNDLSENKTSKDLSENEIETILDQLNSEICGYKNVLRDIKALERKAKK